MKKFIFFVFFTTVCFGEEIPKIDDIKITADNMQYDTLKKSAHANGNVKLSYYVNGLPVTLTAINLKAQFDDDGTLVKVVADGDVKIEHDGSCLYAQDCTHNFNDQKAVCVGNDVKLAKNNNEIHGNTAIIDFSTQIFAMESNSNNQISSVIYPEKEKHHKNS